MSCGQKQDSFPSLFPGLAQIEKCILSENVKIWKRQLPDQGTRGNPVTFFSQNGLDGKLSLVLIPLLASAGLFVPKILWPSLAEGRSLESNLHTISGMKLTFAPEEMRSILEFSGGVFAYAPEPLRTFHDRFASPEKSEWGLFSLICILTMSGLNAKCAVFDIKIKDSQSGLDINSARKYAFALQEYSRQMGMNTSFLLSYMPQLLGQALGPVLEIIEAFEILKGRGPHDVKKLVLELGSDLLLSAKTVRNRSEAKSTLKSLILRGDALNKAKEIICAQGGNFRIVNDYSELPEIDHTIDICASKTGFLARMKTASLKMIRDRLMSIHPGAGLIVHVNVGDPVKEGSVLAKIHFPEPQCSLRLLHEIRGAFVVTDSPPDFIPFIAEKIRGDF